MDALPVVADPVIASTPQIRRAVALRRLGSVLAFAAVAEALGVLLVASVGDLRFTLGLDLPTIGFLASILPFPAVVRLAVPGGIRLQALVLGPRSDGRPHDPRAIADVEEVVGLVAMALRLPAGAAGGSGAADAAPTGRAAVVEGSPSSG